MGLLQIPDIVFDVDDVLRSQGADPAILRARRPALVTLAEKAIQEGSPLLHPQVAFREFPVSGIRHDQLVLEGGFFRSAFLVKNLARAQKVVVILATVGDELEKHVLDIGSADILYALALDGVGSAAVEALANAACRYFETAVPEQGLQASIPFSPGMVGWSVEDGQKDIFRLMDGSESGVRLTESSMMIPRKSLSLVMGMGSGMTTAEKTCDYCPMQTSCRYQERFET